MGLQVHACDAPEHEDVRVENNKATQPATTCRDLVQYFSTLCLSSSL